MDKIIQVVTTGDSRDIMDRIGKNLVEKRLASCVQLSGPIISTYWWKGKIEETTEWVCTLKSTSELYAKVEAVIRELHPYEIPEIIAIDVENALPEYADWVREETSRTSRGGRT
jgi:periplasmic divalent cation tolerance protein